MVKIPFTKMHGIGNDFIIINQMNARYNFTKNQFLHFIANYARVDDSVLNGGELFDDTKSGYALGYSANTLIGPLSLKYSWSPDTKKNFWYFNLGFWF